MAKRGGSDQPPRVRLPPSRLGSGASTQGMTAITPTWVAALQLKCPSLCYLSPSEMLLEFSLAAGPGRQGTAYNITPYPDNGELAQNHV
jgi:hypothetical protein